MKVLQEGDLPWWQNAMGRRFPCGPELCFCGFYSLSTSLISCLRLNPFKGFLPAEDAARLTGACGVWETEPRGKCGAGLRQSCSLTCNSALALRFPTSCTAPLNVFSDSDLCCLERIGCEPSDLGNDALPWWGSWRLGGEVWAMGWLVSEVRESKFWCL